MLDQNKIKITCLLGCALMASGCQSSPAGMNGGSPDAQTPPAATGGLGSHLANLFAFGETGGRDPYSSPGGSGDYYPTPTWFDSGPSGGGRK
jgi:hypothetical protein